MPGPHKIGGISGPEQASAYVAAVRYLGWCSTVTLVATCYHLWVVIARRHLGQVGGRLVYPLVVAANTFTSAVRRRPAS
jgi:hypothetical protein